MTVMTSEEIAEYKEKLRKWSEILGSSKEEARKLLTHVGILLPDGRLSEWYKDLCGLDKSHDVRY
jgi:hypothetical protein